MAAAFRIREAVTADTAAMVAIEQSSFGDPWSAAAFVAAFGPLTLVAELDGAVAGYVIGRHAADEAEILDLAVRRDVRRRGVARRLIDAVAARSRRLGLARVYLEVRESNTAAVGLYAQRGFQQVGRRSAYYRSPSEDALVLALD